MIKNLLIVSLILLFQSSLLFSQSLIRSDDFESTTFPSSINWSGDTSRFLIVDLNGSKRLRLNAETGATKASIALPDSINYGKLHFDVFFNFSGLSSSNRLNVYFGLNKKMADGTYSGYLLQAGETGSADVFRLFKVTNGSLSQIGADTTQINDGGSFSIDITRDTSGTFSVAVGKGLNAQTFPFISVLDTSFTHQGYVVFESLFTSTRTTSTSFDNITLSKFKPFLKSASVLNENSLLLNWSESINTVSSA